MALESVGDKILYHHQSQSPVYKESRMQYLPRDTGKGGRSQRKLGDACVAFYKRAQAIKKKEEEENAEESKRTAFSMAITPLSQRFSNSTSSLVRKNPWLLSLPSRVREYRCYRLHLGSSAKAG